MHNRLVPKLFTVWREGYAWPVFGRDLLAGIIVGIVALPLSIALAIASGLKPEQGLYTAIVAGFLIAMLSGSRVQIGGPTGAFIVLVYDTVQRYGVEGMAIATLMAGALLVCMGLAGLGGVIKFIPYPVTVGFTSGIAVIIFVSQVRDALGLAMPAPPAEFIEKLLAYREHLHSLNPHAMAMTLLAFLLMTWWPRVSKRVPGSLVAIILATVAAIGFELPVETIGSRFGEIPQSLPRPRLPVLDWAHMRPLISPAFAIAILAGIESLLSAVVADGMTGRRHRSNMELVAQGVANLVSPLFGGMPATGAIARTATNIRNGGLTPVSGMIHALTVLLLMTVCGGQAARIPMPVLAAILMRVAVNMGEWHLFVRLFRSPKSDVLVLLSTFGLTIFVDLTVAIEVGVVMAAFLFMKRMADVTEIGFLRRELRDPDESEDTPTGPLPKGIEVFAIQGPFFFGAAERFKDTIRQVDRLGMRVLIFRLDQVPAMDATALRALEDVVDKCRREGIALILSGVRHQPMRLLRQAGLLAKLPPEHLCPAYVDALALAQRLTVAPDHRRS